MILELILGLFFSIAGFLLDFMPDLSGLESLSSFSSEISVFIDFLSLGFVIFPSQLFLIFFGNVLFWLSVQLSWSIVEWVYKKIPGVD